MPTLSSTHRRSSHAASSRAWQTDDLLAALQRCEGADAERVIGRLVEVNMDLARTIARRYYGRSEHAEDLDQVAYLGLTMAVRRFDPRRGETFLAFAVPTILGELRRHFRDRCWVVRPPRRIQELQGRIMQAIETFSHEYGRAPDPQEIAEVLAVDTVDVVEALTADGCFTPTSLDQPAEPSSTLRIGDLLGTEESGYDVVEARAALRPLISRLAERDRRVLELRYLQDRTQQQIAEEIGVTQMQVSRILSRIRATLAAQLGAVPDARPRSCTTVAGSQRSA